MSRINNSLQLQLQQLQRCSASGHGLTFCGKNGVSVGSQSVQNSRTAQLQHEPGKRCGPPGGQAGTDERDAAMRTLEAKWKAEEQAARALLCI